MGDYMRPPHCCGLAMTSIMDRFHRTPIQFIGLVKQTGSRRTRSRTAGAWLRLLRTVCEAYEYYTRIGIRGCIRGISIDCLSLARSRNLFQVANWSLSLSESGIVGHSSKSCCSSSSKRVPQGPGSLNVNTVKIGKRNV